MIEVEHRAPIGLTARYAIAGLGVAALLAFVGITYGVTHDGAMTSADLRDFAARQSTITPVDQRVCVIVSRVGSPVAMAMLAVVGALWLGWRRRFLFLVSWIAAFAGASVLVVALKQTIHRARPVGAELFLHGASLSFPSGHAVGSMVGFGMLSYLLTSYWATRNTQRACLVVVVIGFVGAIAASRLCLGVHYLSDVLAGLAIGTAWLASCVLATEGAYRWRAHTLA